MVKEIIENSYLIILGIVSVIYFLYGLYMFHLETHSSDRHLFPIRNFNYYFIEIGTLFCFSLSLGIVWPLVIIFILVYLVFNFYDYCKKK